MSTRSRRPLPNRILLTNDLERPHGPRVNVIGLDGRELGWLDRPLAEFLQDALEQKGAA